SGGSAQTSGCSFLYCLLPSTFQAEIDNIGSFSRMCGLFPGAGKTWFLGIRRGLSTDMTVIEGYQSALVQNGMMTVA
ncbi:hypothetical protein BGX30_007005, partial [Mortierella sp. GBA39]